jgi:serine/threonine protein kinase
MKKQFDRFILTGLVVQSTGGSIYSGEEKLPGDVTRPVLVKVLPALSKGNPSGEKRFIDEVRVLAALAGQPHVVTFYGMGITDNVPWIATEHAQANLTSQLGATPADPPSVVRMIEQVAQGLGALHAMQPPMLHNRLHPGSILVCAGNYYKVTDFGLASPWGAEPTLSLETIRYAAPELLNKEFGPVGPAADLYALGHIAYEMALGSKLHRQQFPAVWADAAKPADASPARWQAWHHSMPTVVPPAQEVVRGFPPSLGELIARLTAKPLASRYTSVSDLLSDLRSASLSGAPTTAPQATPQVTTPPPPPPRGFARSAPTSSSAGSLMPGPAISGFRPRQENPETAPPASPAPTGYTPPSGERFYIRLRDRTTGPFDLTVLQRMARQGQLSRLHQLSTDQQSWKPAASVEGLFG